MSDIVGARKDLRRIARQLRHLKQAKLAAEIQKVIDTQMYRRTPVRKMPRKSRPVTAQVKAKIIDLAESTDLHAEEIAVRVGVNSGRVSEVLHGDR